MVKTAGLVRTALMSLTLLLVSVASSAEDFPGVMFILDGSGSMWGSAGGQTKIEAGRAVMNTVVPSLPPELTVGLTSYGHRRKGDCQDIEVLVPIENSDRRDLLDKVDAISPKGKTPIAATVETVAESLRAREHETTIVLISDGEETCKEDPCAAVRALKESDIKFKLHVVGFDVNTSQKEQLECLASAGGGDYHGASDAASLQQALQAVTAPLEKKVEAIRVEKAKATKKKAVTKLGKLEVVFPESGERSLANFEIRRVSDRKVIKTVKAPKSTTIHPLLADDYSVVLGFANSNHRPPTEAPLSDVTVTGGETTTITLGAIAFDIAKEITQLPVEAISLINTASGEPFLTLRSGGNSYYLYRPKPVPAGTYNVAFEYSQVPTPLIVARSITVSPAMEPVVSLDSGIRIKEVEGQNITGWDLVRTDDQITILEVRRRWDNEFPLWRNFVVPSGTYDLNVHIKGMEVPLPAGEGLQIGGGQLLEFDTGF